MSCLIEPDCTLTIFEYGWDEFFCCCCFICCLSSCDVSLVYGGCRVNDTLVFRKFTWHGISMTAIYTTTAHTVPCLTNWIATFISNELFKLINFTVWITARTFSDLRTFTKKIKFSCCRLFNLLQFQLFWNWEECRCSITVCKQVILQEYLLILHRVYAWNSGLGMKWRLP